MCLSPHPVGHTFEIQRVEIGRHGFGADGKDPQVSKEEALSPQRIKEIEDMDGKVIALSLGTTNEKAVKRVMKEKGLNIKIVSVKDHPQAWLAVETGRVDAYATDDVLLYGLISKSKNKVHARTRYWRFILWTAMTAVPLWRS